NQASGTCWTLECEFAPATSTDSLVILLHPHPLYGGNMHNNVVRNIFNACKEGGHCAMCFNFSGVGASEGTHEGGTGEMGQVNSVIDFMSHEFRQRQGFHGNWSSIHVVGYSFGAAVGMPPALSHPDVSSYVSIANPFDMFTDISEKSVALQGRFMKRIMFMTGDGDDFTPVSRFKTWAARFKGPVTTEIIPRADHFFVGSEHALYARLGQFLYST
nr:hypothetical protein [Candidatus Sigynarchaeota archaeon]